MRRVRYLLPGREEGQGKEVGVRAGGLGEVGDCVGLGWGLSRTYLVGAPLNRMTNNRENTFPRTRWSVKKATGVVESLIMVQIVNVVVRSLNKHIIAHISNKQTNKITFISAREGTNVRKWSLDKHCEYINLLIRLRWMDFFSNFKIEILLNLRNIF